MRGFPLFALIGSIFIVAGFMVGNSLFQPAPLVITDVNQNGIWDDVEESLSRKYAQWPHLKPASIEMGKVLQEFLENPTASDLVERDRYLARAISCVVASAMIDGLNIDEATDQVSVIRDLVVNNDIRHERWVKVNDQLAGHYLSFDAPNMSRCPDHIKQIE